MEKSKKRKKIKTTKKKKKVIRKKKTGKKVKTKKIKSKKRKKLTKTRKTKKIKKPKRQEKKVKNSKKEKHIKEGKSPRKKRRVKAHEEILIGRVTHYFDNIRVVAITLLKTLNKGDEIHFVGGENTDFRQKASSLEINHSKIKRAKKGTEVGLKVNKKVREGYRVYR